MRYKIVRAETSQELEILVNEILSSSNFEPLGGVSITCYPYENQREGFTDVEYTYVQALVDRTSE